MQITFIVKKKGKKFVKIPVYMRMPAYLLITLAIWLEKLAARWDVEWLGINESRKYLAVYSIRAFVQLYVEKNHYIELA